MNILTLGIYEGDKNGILVIATLVFSVLLLGFLFNFFTIFLRFLNAKGCFAAILLTLTGFPALLILLLSGGHTTTSILITVLSVIGVITGYITRDTKGNTGTFGYFLMILSIIILVITVLASGLFDIF